ncbi:MAG: HDOD domain-containing protein, partial [Leptospiraceae bacterium]|nr:HDOD domain-containing protein [Leptospiraceae bacterium]
AGLLHDIGKLILLSLGKEITEKIQSLKTREKTNSVIMEEYSIGISHAEVAGLLLEKWSFPEDLVSVCRYHHKPFLAPEEHKEIVELIYLANFMVDVLDLKASFTTIYPEALKILKIDREEQFTEIIQRFEKSYQSLGKV